MVDWSICLEFASGLRLISIAVIEDACQAPGAVLNNRPVGSWGDCAALSFGGSKLLTAGRGGSGSEHHQRRLLSGSSSYNERGNIAYPLSEMQAAVLRSSSMLDWRMTTSSVSNLSSCLRELLSEQDGLKPFSMFAMLRVPPATTSWGCTFHQWTSVG